FGLQQLQRLARRDAADLPPLRDVLDGEPLAGLRPAAQDRPPDGVVDELLLGPVGRARVGRGHRAHVCSCCPARIGTRAFPSMASSARRQATADPIASSGPHRSGVPARMAEQNPAISARYAASRSPCPVWPPLGPVPAASAARLSDASSTGPGPAGVIARASCASLPSWKRNASVSP